MFEVTIWDKRKREVIFQILRTYIVKDIDINMFPYTKPIFIPPYNKTLVKSKELKEALNGSLNKGLI